jgi:hypothetical protein
MLPLQEGNMFHLIFNNEFLVAIFIGLLVANAAGFIYAGRKRYKTLRIKPRTAITLGFLSLLLGIVIWAGMFWLGSYFTHTLLSLWAYKFLVETIISCLLFTTGYLLLVVRSKR